MAEIFLGTPAVVSVTITDSEQHQVTYHVAGRDMEAVKDAVREALGALPDPDPIDKPKKERKPRRTKAEMAEAEPKSKGTPWLQGE